MNLGEAKSHVRHAIGGYPSVAPGQTVNQRTIEVINHAGRHLYARPWRFREATATLNTNADLRTVGMPRRYEEVVSLTRTVDGEAVELTTPEDMDRLFDGNSGTSISGYINRATIAWVAGNPQLLVWPTPRASEESVLRLRYRQSWDNIADPDGSDAWGDTRRLDPPPYAEQVFIAYLRAFAVGYEDEGLNERIAVIEAGPLLQTTLMKDGIQSRDVGRLKPQRGRTFR
jgi:hypothetical protein